MTESIGDLLNKQRFAEPPEIKIIQNYVLDRFKVKPQVTVSERQIIIGVKSGALAGALRPLLLDIQAACQTKKRLLIRIQ